MNNKVKNNQIISKRKIPKFQTNCQNPQKRPLVNQRSQNRIFKIVLKSHSPSSFIPQLVRDISNQGDEVCQANGHNRVPEQDAVVSDVLGGGWNQKQTQSGGPLQKHDQTTQIGGDFVLFDVVDELDDLLAVLHLGADDGVLGVAFWGGGEADIIVVLYVGHLAAFCLLIYFCLFNLIWLGWILILEGVLDGLF